VAAPNASIPAATNACGPKIQFATPIYDFGRVKSGEPVKYTFIFTNTGDQVLEITHVQPSCHCTTAGEWTKKVEPGQTGTIPIQFDSTGMNGPLVRTITVNSTDKSQAVTVLQVKGTAWMPLELIPRMAILNLPPDAPSGSTVVRILNNTEEPITLSPPESNNRAFAATLTNNIPGKEYQLTISTVPPLTPGTLSAQISIKTSWTNPAVLTVPLYATVPAPVMVIPPQITLPPAPLREKMMPSITIQTSSTNQLSLSDASVNAEGVEVQVLTMQTGRLYSVTLSFPQGFEIPQGQQAAFTVKSSNPQMPLIKVPVLQMPRPVAPPPPQPSAFAPPPPQPPPPQPAAAGH
jgi:hypothetical protein